MEIVIEKKENVMNCCVTGKIDTVTSTELQKKVDLSDVTDVTFDLSNVDYLSSAGLRFFIVCHKTLAAKSGSLKIVKIQDHVKEVFDMVGLDSILDLS
ncbi:MAG: STAS domain-containing protein [Alphaproteobacteria bacterium]|nr:STAS domain-containing protein [Alphaproteobacteria bacterium]